MRTTKKPMKDSEISKEEKTAYWSVVEDCLQKVHSLTKASAHGKTNALRRKLKNAPDEISGDFIYHDEPFYVACDIAGKHDTQEQARLLAQNREIYKDIRASRKW